MKINKNKKVHDLLLWTDEKGAIKELKPLCRKLAGEGSVLLKNDRGLLPLKKGAKIAVFGRTQETYYRSGTGSGGCVNTERMPCIIDTLLSDTDFCVDKEIKSVYESWIKENPMVINTGWASELWSQEEMPLEKSIVSAAAKRNDAAVIIIGRSAGEDHDNADEEGSYRLTKAETDMIKTVGESFENTIVFLNVGNIVDMSFLDFCNVTSLLIVWQGGETGDLAIADIISGRTYPSGKLTDTCVKDLKAYPDYEAFGDDFESIYSDDIFVGYRYFETFDKNAVRFPFGFGMTYTEFSSDYKAEFKDGKITVAASFKNIGKLNGRQVLQVYCKKPCDVLTNPARELIGFAKTAELKSGESETLAVNVDFKSLASYDDSGATGNKSCYCLLKGDYEIFAGTDVRNAEKVLSINNDTLTVTERLTEICAPEKVFDRIKAVEINGGYEMRYEPAPLRTADYHKAIGNGRPKDLEYTGDKGIKLLDVADGKNTMDEFVAQLSDDALRRMSVGEGMSSFKVTYGTGAAFGGLDFELSSFGIPACCVTDGPSGLRIDDGSKATLLPNGTLFATSFDIKAAEEIFELLGVEAFRYNIDALLGPGLNIHKSPLNGRNFEYFSEDPFVSGKMAAAMTRAIAKSGVTTTIKHFCCNNQEHNRYSVNAVVSERALREIYLKGFEIAVKEGGATSVMTSYNPVNGRFTSSQYEILSTVLREEWGFSGMVMTDWWTKCGELDDNGKDKLKYAVRAQNDIYMVASSADLKESDILSGLRDGFITRGELQRNIKNLLNYIVKTPSFERFADGGCKVPDILMPAKIEDYEKTNEFADLKSEVKYESVSGNRYPALFELEYSSESPILAQDKLIFEPDWLGGYPVMLNGTDKKVKRVTFTIPLDEKPRAFTMKFSDKIKIKKLICYKHK